MYQSGLADGLLRFAKIGFVAGLFSLALGWFVEKNDFPPSSRILPVLAQDPRQEPTSAPPFAVDFEGVRYQVEPLYEYELWGLVVSMHHSDSWRDYHHKNSGDFLNVVDFCVVWGKNNALSGVYEKISFSSGQFTCFWKASDPTIWNYFKNEEASNNHIVVADQAIRRQIRKVRIGDQIHFRGQLVKYRHPKWTGFRSSSTTRTDTGPGACETVFVRDFEILKAGPRRGLMLRWIGGILTLASILSFVAFFCLPERFYSSSQ